MAWQLRHQGSPKVIPDLTLQEVVDGLRDGLWETTDEVQGPGETRWQTIDAHPKLAELAEELETPPPTRHADATSLDMNALIDVCLVLLIFFILTTSYANMVQKVVPLPAEMKESENKPKSAKVRVIKAEDVKARMIRVQASLDGAGKPVLRVENQAADVMDKDGKLDVTRLADVLRPYVRRKTEIILDARGVTWETFIQIQDGARAAGVQVIHQLKQK